MKIILVPIIVISLIITGCNGPADSQSDSLMNIARQKYDSQDYPAAVSHLNELLSSDISSSQRGQGYYLRGLAYRQQGREYLPQAKRDLKMAVRYGRSYDVVALANTALGHICFESDPPDSAMAVHYYKNALDTDSENMPKDAIYYRLAVSFQHTGQWQQAQKYFKRCITEYPASNYAIMARQENNTSQFSLQVGVYSNMANARTMVQKLKADNWPARIELLTGKGKVQYAVRTGNFQTYNSALAQLHELKQIQPQAFITADK